MVHVLTHSLGSLGSWLWMVREIFSSILLAASPRCVPTLVACTGSKESGTLFAVVYIL